MTPPLARTDSPELRDGDLLVIASRVVSLAAGRYVDLESVPVPPRAERIAGGRVSTSGK